MKDSDKIVKKVREILKRQLPVQILIILIIAVVYPEMRIERMVDNA